MTSGGGDKIIKDVREANIFNDVIFYSTVRGDVKQAVFDNDLDGVYFSSRDPEHFELKVINVMDMTIKRYHDINNLRGLVMSETSEFDALMDETITTYIDQKNTPTDWTPFIHALKTWYDNNAVSGLPRCFINFSYSDFTAYKDNFTKFTSYMRMMTIGYILGQNMSVTYVGSGGTFMDEYKSEILDYRNMLAHTKAEQEVDLSKSLTFKGKKITFNEAKYIEIKENLKKYKEFLEELNKNI